MKQWKFWLKENEGDNELVKKCDDYWLSRSGRRWNDGMVALDVVRPGRLVDYAAKDKKRIVRLGDYFNICSAASYKASLVNCSIKMQEEDHFGFEGDTLLVNWVLKHKKRRDLAFKDLSKLSKQKRIRKRHYSKQASLFYLHTILLG